MLEGGNAGRNREEAASIGPQRNRWAWGRSGTVLPTRRACHRLTVDRGLPPGYRTGPSVRRPRATALALLACLGAPAVGAQEQPFRTPEAVARRFYDAFQSARWADVAGVLHPEALDLFRYRVLAVVRADGSGSVARRLYDAGPAEVEALSDPSLVAGLMRGVFGYARGMMQAMMTKEVQVLGHVPEEREDGSLAHVVLRSREPLSGTAPSTVSVLTLKRTEAGWRVRWSQELDVVASALVALPTEP